MSCRIPDETIANIKALRRMGHSISEIVAQTGVSRCAVHGFTKGIQLPFGPLKRGPKRKVARNVCLRLQQQGLTYRAIAARIGCGVGTVHRVLNKRAA